LNHPPEHRNSHPRRLTRLLAGILGAALAVPAAAGAADVAAGRVPGKLMPRRAASKPERTVIPPGYSDRILHVKFVEGTAVRLRGGAFANLGGDDLTGLREVLRRHPGARIDRLFSRSEEVLAAEKRRIEAKSGREQADKNLYYRIRLRPGTDLPAFADALNALEIVEKAYPEPLPMPLPVTPDFSGEQGYLGAAPDGIDAGVASEVCGGRGAAVTLLDIEYSWNLAHEDLGSAASALVPNQTPVDPFNSNDHGTAVLGEVVAGNNGFGVTGIVHDAGVLVVNANNDEDGYDLADSIDIAHSNLSAGDVMLIEQQIAGPNGCNNGVSGCVAVEWVEDYYDAIVAATSDGIIVVEAAGNGGENLDDSGTYGSPFPDGRADSGAIIVGSGGVDGCVNPERSRRPSSTYGARVNLQGWGECVVTTGYGTRQGGPVNEWYASGFNGTSSASPIVAGAAASLSSAAQTLGLGAPAPTTVRSILMSTGTPQNTGMGTLSGNIGPLPDLKAALAAYETVPPSPTCPASVTAECTSPAGAAVIYSATATDDCDPTPTVTCSPPSGSTFPLGTTPTSCDALDAVDNQSTCSFPVTVEDTTPPVLNCPSDVTVECTGNCGIEASDPQLAGFFASATAADVCDPSLVVTNDAPSFFNLGSTIVNFLVVDDSGNASGCAAVVTVVDTTPPVITASLDRDVLWPPNHKWSVVTATVAVTDVCDPNAGFVLTSITSDEPENGLGDGDQAPDVDDADFGTPDTEFRLRSERGGLGDGRVYTITYTAFDKSGNTTPVVLEVRVPHDRAGVALSAEGFNARGQGFASGAAAFVLVIPSAPGFDAAAVDPLDAYVGNTIAAVRPLGSRLVDRNGDGLPDLELTYPVAPVRWIRSQSGVRNPAGLHYDTGPDLEDYLVLDIFRLGAPLAPETP
jgi:hypothetical protein